MAIALAEGALQGCVADIAVSVTGVAGPDTDEKGNPVGRVFFSCARRGSMTVSEKREFGNIGRISSSPCRYVGSSLHHPGVR